MNEYLPELTIKMTDDFGHSILLTQAHCGEDSVVEIHPLHLRFMCEKLGLFPRNDEQLAKENRTLTRRNGLLADRLNRLADLLDSNRSADISSLQASARAGADLASEFRQEHADSRVESGLAGDDARRP